jgi:hypothetical protein
MECALKEPFKKLAFRPEFRAIIAAKWSLSLTDFPPPPQFVKRDV